MLTLRVGTSGWQYRDWRGAWYPEKLAQSRWLEHYVDHFATVELNNSFYRLPSAETFETWTNKLPADFLMAVKASRYLTHIKRLRDPEEPVQRFVDSIRPLGRKLGPVLMQLPPRMHVDAGRLDAALACFPRNVRVTVELRDKSWFTDEVRTVLVERAAALCLADRQSRPVSPLWRTADWTYLRFHEGRGADAPCYGDEAMRSWVGRLQDAWDGCEGFVYFNNDARCCAVHDAVRFSELARRAGAEVTRTPAAGEVHVWPR
jgi:uncharacterized protein YecE (DUF72 family)